MLKSYLELSRFSDVKSSRDRAFFRLFEILPGFLSWGTLIIAFLLSWLAPIAVAIFIIIFDFFWLLRITYLSCHQIASYRQMKKNLATDWVKKLKNLKRKKWEEIYHLVILPTYKESRETIRPTLQSLADSDYPKNKIIVILSTEEKAGKVALETAKEIEKEFKRTFFHFISTVHPKDVPGEVAGKGSNVAWAINKARELIDKLSIPYENIIVSNFDIDTRPYPQYFAILTWHYLTEKNPLKSSYQPIPIYNNNIWQASAFSRVIATSGTFWQMMQQERQEQLVTYSSHSLPFKVLDEVGYPKNVVSDDSRIFWKSFLYYGGNCQVIPLHYPVSMDAVMAKALLRTFINQYKQQRRWAWGCENISYILYGFLKNKKIALREKIRHSFVILDGFWSWSTSALLIFFLGWLPLIIGSQSFQGSLLSYNLPRITSYIMSVAMIGMVVSAITSLLLLPPRPREMKKWKKISMVFQWILLPLILIIFGAFPSLDAQMRLLLGKYLGFWVTEKAPSQSF